MSGSTASRALPNSDSVNLSGRFLRDGSSLWKHADLCQDAISADFAAPLDEIADWIRSAWRVIPSAGICSSQNPDSSLWVLPIVRSTNSRDRATAIRFAVKSGQSQDQEFVPAFPIVLLFLEDDGRGVRFCPSPPLPTRRCTACGMATLEDTIGSIHKMERSRSAQVHLSATAFFVATFPFYPPSR